MSWVESATEALFKYKFQSQPSTTMCTLSTMKPKDLLSQIKPSSDVEQPLKISKNKSPNIKINLIFFFSPVRTRLIMRTF